MSQAWTAAEVLALFEMPFMDLVFRAQSVHRENFDPNAIQRSTLLSVKTGGCSEDCRYCSQSAHYDTAVQKERMLPLETVLAAAQTAKDKGATRFCMGAAGRKPRKDEMPRIVEMIEGVKALGMETCVTLGMLSDEQANELKEAGLDYYNHNLDTDKDFYGNVIRSHTHERAEALSTPSPPIS
jgi:biotin synthase